MTQTTGRSADEAIILFQHLVNKLALLRVDDPEQSEADTRAKLIDPIFINVLGWRESDIKREDPAEEGFADYSFGAEFKWFHVEAKRTVPRFELHSKSRSRRLKLSGPHLLGNKEMRKIIEQTAKYAPDLGTQFAVLTNGSQFILFEATPRGKSWRDGHALVWHDHRDVDENFAEFFNLLARCNVEAGVLREKFASATSITQRMYTPLEFVHNPDGELVRNPFWNKISQAFSPLLIDQPENAALQEEVIRHCYVSTPLAHESSNYLGKLLRDIMPSYIEDAGARHLGPDERSAGAFRTRLIDDLKMAKPGTYVLTGGVGSGKTSFLRRFATVDQYSYISDFCIWLHIDYLPIGGDPTGISGREIEDFTYTRILILLNEKYPKFVPKTGDDIRRIFGPEVENLTLTLLYGIDPAALEYRVEVNRLVNDLINNRERYLNAILRDIRKQGRSIVFVLDNTDQQGERFQKAVFLFSQKLSDSYSTLSIVSLREDKFFAAYRLGVFDAYGTRKFHIGSPELIDVIKKRLNYGLKRYRKLAEMEGITNEERQRNQLIVKLLIDSSTIKNGNIIRFLTCVSAGDMRLAIAMFNDFMSSGNTDTKKIVQKALAAKGDPYCMPFHEFAKSAILGARRYYRGSVSRVLNVFAPSSAQNASYWTACRVLARLLSSQHNQSVYGEGYIPTNDILREYRESFGMADDCIETCERMLLAGLLESEPPRMQKLGESEALRITATGAYYWSYLIRSFAYLDLVLVDTPLVSEDLAKEMAALSEKRKEDYMLADFIKIRIKRVMKFLDSITQIDIKEIDASVKQGGPYNECLSVIIRDQIDKEIVVIRHRTGA